MATLDKPKIPCTWNLDDIGRLRRFLCLGSESGAYESNDHEEKEPSSANAQCIMSLLEAGRGNEVVEEIKKYSVGGRIAKQHTLIFALAMVAKKSKDAEVKQAAFAAVPDVCRIPTHLFQFVKYSEAICDTTGWGRGQRNAISRWYNAIDSKKLALFVTKYRQRGGWSHRDLFRLSHLRPNSEALTLIVKYVIKGLDQVQKDYGDSAADDVRSTLVYLGAVETVKQSRDEEEVARLVEKHGLVWEQVPTWMMKSKKVWSALLPHMPLEALIRSLGRLAGLELLSEATEGNCIQAVMDRLNKAGALQKARVHPILLLSALTAYRKGCRGNERPEKAKRAKWAADQGVENALESAFYNSFVSVPQTGLRFLYALETSTLKGSVAGTPSLSPGDAAIAMVLAGVRAEPHCDVVTFSSVGMTTVDVTGEMTLEGLRDAVNETASGAVDIARPMTWAQDNNKQYDVFVVYTGVAAYGNNIHPADALRKYRTALNKPQARLVICSLTAASFTVADPDDAGMLDVAGFDSAVPQVIHNFVSGQLS